MEINKGDIFKCIKSIDKFGFITAKYQSGKDYVSTIDGYIEDDYRTNVYWDSSSPEIYFKKTGLIGHQKKEEEVIGAKNDSGKLPYFTVLFKQFPLALKEVMKCSKAGNQKYHKTDKDWQNFSRVDKADTRYKDAMLRHMSEDGQVEDMTEYGGMTHEGAVVWNALADLEIKLRKLK